MSLFTGKFFIQLLFCTSHSVATAMPSIKAQVYVVLIGILYAKRVVTLFNLHEKMK